MCRIKRKLHDPAQGQDLRKHMLPIHGQHVDDPGLEDQLKIRRFVKRPPSLDELRDPDVFVPIKSWLKLRLNWSGN